MPDTTNPQTGRPSTASQINTAFLASLNESRALNAPLIAALSTVFDSMERARPDEWAMEWLGEVWSSLPLEVRAAAGDTDAAQELADLRSAQLAAAPTPPSAPADRALLLRAADHLTRSADQLWPKGDSVMHADGIRLRRLADEQPATGPGRVAGEAQQDQTQAGCWHLTPQTLDLFVRALVNEVDYDIHKGWECGEEDGEDHYPELVADAAEMLNAITAEQPAVVSQPGKENDRG
ncbi:hypothetical protein [Streptomyces sp. NPDC050564]|uniref:hypothetical protein n=1 Tax=Streptomyces sp. NPDC050564 TaxID=3365631 RepID=UPI0037886960